MSAILNFTRDNNLSCEQGATFEVDLVRYDISDSCPPVQTPVQYDGYTFTMAVRQKYSSTTTLIILTSDSGGGITIDAPNGKITLRIEASVTDTFPSGRYVYDIMANSGSNIYRLYEGAFEVTPEVRAS